MLWGWGYEVLRYFEGGEFNVKEEREKMYVSVCMCVVTDVFVVDFLNKIFKEWGFSVFFGWL